MVYIKAFCGYTAQQQRKLREVGEYEPKKQSWKLSLSDARKIGMLDHARRI